MVDCLIAGIAIRAGTTVLHHEADFDTLARHTRLQVVAVPGWRSGGTGPRRVPGDRLRRPGGPPEHRPPAQ
jgi:hypothetical protein